MTRVEATGWRALAPVKLWRLLIGNPWPTLALPSLTINGTRFDGLRARAWTETERITAIERADDGATMIATCALTSASTPLFASADEVMELAGPDAARIGNAITAALDTLVPPLILELDRALLRGASDARNSGLAYMMHESQDVLPNGGRRRRPDLFWGRPFVNLTTGQIAAYIAACKIIERARTK